MWASITFTPNIFKMGVESALERIRVLIEGLDEKKQQLEQEGSKALAPFGKKLVFPQVDLEVIRHLSLNDVQTIQALAEWKPIQCSKEFRAIIEPLAANPGFRLVLEMFNIPTDAELLMEVCPGGPKTVTEVVKETMGPVVIDDGMPSLGVMGAGTVGQPAKEALEAPAPEVAAPAPEVAAPEPEEAAPAPPAAPKQQGGSRKRSKSRLRSPPPSPSTTLSLHRHSRKAVKKLQKVRRKTPKARRLA